MIGCNDTAKQASQPPPADELTRPQVLMPSNAPGGASARTTGSISAQPAIPQSMPPIPPGSRWTIFCYVVKDDPRSGIRGAHISGASGTRDALRGKTGSNDWYVIHGQDASNLYFGFYKSVDPNDKLNPTEVARAQRDLDMVRKLRSADPVNPYPFERAAFVALDTPDPTAPPEWNLFNVDREKNPIDPKRAFWSLQIMAFKGHPLRKEAAVQAVADLRAKGVEAYYYHGEIVSSVTVGKWTYDAVKEQPRTDEFKDTAGASAGTPMVVPNFPIGEQETAKPIDGRRAVSVAPKLEVQNAEMLQVMRQFPTHAVNYEIGVARTQEGQAVEDPSFLVEIPRARGNGRFENMQSTGGTAAQQRDGDWGRVRGPSMINPGGGRSK